MIALFILPMVTVIIVYVFFSIELYKRRKRLRYLLQRNEEVCEFRRSILRSYGVEVYDHMVDYDQMLYSDKPLQPEYWVTEKVRKFQINQTMKREIQASELRIGNYITDIHSPNSYYPVVELKKNICEFGPSYVIAYDKLRPVPLTEEWLLKLGFELDYKSEWTIKYSHKEHGEIGYDYAGRTGYWCARYYGHHIDCKYVHQLQNLFLALTGEELTITPELITPEVK